MKRSQSSFIKLNLHNGFKTKHIATIVMIVFSNFDRLRYNTGLTPPHYILFIIKSHTKGNSYLSSVIFIFYFFFWKIDAIAKTINFYKPKNFYFDNDCGLTVTNNQSTQAHNKIVLFLVLQDYLLILQLLNIYIT